jgi:hypothetical protein
MMRRLRTNSEKESKMNNEFIFLLGDGHLPSRAAKIATKHDAKLINHTDPQCKCGHNCELFECKWSRRHWFVSENLGEPFNTKVREAVEAALDAANIAT